jgi:hypothetical protein
VIGGAVSELDATRPTPVGTVYRFGGNE